MRISDWSSDVGSSDLASDDRGAVAYEVLRDDRAIATVSELTYLDPALDDGHRYAVRSIDAAGNRSASTPVQEVVPIPDDARIDLIEAGADWAWRWETAAPPAGWNSPTFEIGRAHSELQSLMRISYAVFCLKKK